MSIENKARRNVICAMFIYGTVGLFVRFIDLPSSIIAMARGLIGVPFLLIVLAVQKKRLCLESIKRNKLPLLISGTLLGFNWILLFEAYRITTVATASLCYYMAPIIIVALSPIVFKEKLTLRKAICIVTALIGMVFVSGVAKNGIPPLSELKGVFLGLTAACFYASIVITNKHLRDIGPYDRTIVQLAISAVWMLLYNSITGGFAQCSNPGTLGLVMLIILGIVHTGIAYLLYFGSMGNISAQTVAILSYIDPVITLILGALILKETMGPYELLGAVLVLGSALISELPEKEKK